MRYRRHFLWLPVFFCMVSCPGIKPDMVCIYFEQKQEDAYLWGVLVCDREKGTGLPKSIWKLKT